MLPQLHVPATNSSSEIGRVLFVARDRIRPFPDQPRKFFDQQKLTELAESIRHVGQIVPISVKELDEPHPDFDYEIVDGQRRWHACEIAGVKKMRAIILTVKDESEQFLISVVSNFGRVDHTPMETALAIQFFKDRGMTNEDIARIFVRSITWITQHLKVLQLDVEVMGMMSSELPEEKQLGFSAAILLADVPKADQRQFAEAIVGQRMKVNHARSFIRSRADKLGVKVGDPNRTPGKDYRNFRSFIGRVKRESETFLEMPQSFFDKMFQHRDADDCNAVIARTEKAIEQLQGLLAALRRTKK